MAYVKEGSRLTYIGQITRGVLSDAWPDILSRVNSSLANIEGISIEKSDTKSEFFSSFATVTLNLLTRGTDYANENDVRALVDHYFYNETGLLPAGSRITQVISPKGTTTATGAPGADETPEAEGGGIGSWFHDLGQKLSGGVTGIVIGAVGIVLLLGIVAAKD